MSAASRLAARARRWTLLVVCAVALVIRGGAARADEEPLTLALYAPTAPLNSAEARFSFIERLAKQLQAAGIPAQGKAFARAQDLDGAIKRGQVDLAVLDGVYLAERGAGFPVLAVATAGGDSAARWGLYTTAGGAGSLQGLSGARLAWVPIGGKEMTFLDNVLLDGEIKSAQFFKPQGPAPDLSGAVSDVLVHRADCVFATELAVAGKGLRRVFEAGRVPNPALVQVQAHLDRALIERIQRAVIGSASLGGLDGWRQSGSEPYRQLKQRLLGRAAQRRLVMTEPLPLLHAVHGGMLAKPEVSPAPPPLRSLFVIPPGIP